MKKIYIVLFVCIATCFSARAQYFAVKTNALYDITATINLGIEFRVAPRWTIDISGNYNPWTFGSSDETKRKWKHIMLQPEARYWFCESLNGHFVALHAQGGAFNWMMGNDFKGFQFLGSDLSRLAYERLQGYFLGGGIAYGYSWILSPHWNFEAEIGFGYSYTWYDVYECVGCGKKIEEDQRHHYVGPTKAALNLVYTF
jgi:hypothetical protein